MVVVREVPLGGPSAKFATLDLSLNSLVPAGGELGFGSSCAVGDERFLTWRVCSHNNRQCLELFELCAHQELSGGCWRVLLPEAVVSVRCVPFAEDDVVVLVVVTSGGLRVARLPQPRNQEAALLQFLNTSARESPLASVAFAPKEGVHLTCADARVGERSEVEVFVGTTSGVTLSVSLPSDGSKAQVKSELRQASSGGFSLFRSPAKATGREQILCSVVCAGESVLTLSEDGKVKRWLGNGKCVVERVVSLDRPNGEGRLLACGIQCLPATEVAVFAMHPEDGDAPVLSLVACSWDRVGDFKPEHSVVECPVVAERLEHAQDGVPGVPADVVSFGPGVLDGDEVLLSVWQGVEDSVTCASSLVETGGRHLKWDTEAVRTQLWEMNGQLEVASLYLDRYQAVEGDEWRSKVPPPAVFMEDLLFRPRWFPTKTILSALDKLLQEHSVQPTSSMPDLHSAQGGMFDAVAVRSHVRRSLGDIALGRSDGETGVLWRDLVELCVNEWRATHDAPLGVSTVDLRSQVEGGGSCTLLVKRGGVSALRAASGTENLFLSLLAQAMSQGGMQGEAFSSSGSEDDDGLRIALQILEWAEVADPGGAIMTQRLMTEGAGLVLEDTLRAAMVENPAPQSVWCDPEAILGRFPEVLSLGAPSGGEGALCLSLQRHLGQLEAFAASQGQGQREHGIGWMEEAVEHACAQVVATHFEVVRSLALLLELLDYHCRSSGSADTSSLRNVLHGRVLPLLSSYHALRWASTKRGGGEGDRTLLSLSVEPVGAPLDLFGWGSREDSSPLLACVALPVKGRIEGRMLSSLYHSQHGGGLGAGTQGWEDLMALCEISYAGTGCKEDWVCEGALLLVKGLCLVQARRLGEAEQCFGKVSREARGCVREIEVLLRNVLGLRQDGRMLALQGRFAELVLSQRVREVIAELFVLHDRQHGLYEVIRDAAGKLCGPHDPQIKYDQAACVTCALRLGIASLSEIGARISALSAVCGDSPDELCALEAAAALAETSQDRLRLALAQQLVGIGHFDEAYNLCAPRFQFCNDLDIERLERLDSELPADDLQDVSMRLMPGAEDAVASLRDRRRQQNAYRCLRTFVSSPQFRKQLHRLCSYPWVGCGNTVDTLLRQLNDVPGDQLDIDTSYQARFVPC
uniref:Nucleoporin Nup120/160 beta-propeller domain-containing protein n=1 Tax=Hemiselmis tepida TaxID=464990 RepID=A0A7S0W812_9CRYP